MDLSPIRWGNINLVLDSVITIDNGTPDAGFPIDNIKLNSRDYRGKVTSSTPSIVIDLTSSLSVDMIQICGSQINGFGYSGVTYQLSQTNDFSGVTPVAITLDQTSSVGTVLLTSPETIQYVRFVFSGGGTYVDISNIFVGLSDKLEEQTWFKQGTLSVGFSDNDRVRENAYTMRFVDKRNKPKFISGSLDILTEEEIKKLRNLYLNNGKHTPAYWVLDEKNNIYSDGDTFLSGPYYLSFDYSEKDLTNGYFNPGFTVSLKEVV